MDWETLTQQAYITLPMAGLVLALLFWRKILTPRAFNGIPVRQTGMGRLDVLAALGAIIFGILLTAVSGLGPQLLQQGKPTLTDGLTIIALQFIQFAPAIGALFALAALAPTRVGAGQTREGFRAFGLLPERPWGDLGVGLLALVTVLPLVSAAILAAQFVGIWLDSPTQQIGHGLLQQFTEVESPWVLGVWCLAVIGLAPIIEELVFRGLLQSATLGLVGKHRRWLGIALTGLLFTAIHLSAAAWFVLPGLFVLTLALGYVYERRHSLLPAIVLHAGFNAINVIYVVFTPVGSGT